MSEEASKIKNGISVQVETGAIEELDPDSGKLRKVEAHFFVTPARARKMLAKNEAERVPGPRFVLRLLKETAADVFERERRPPWTEVSCGRQGYFMNGIAINRRS
jgi:hypothetical protein